MNNKRADPRYKRENPSNFTKKASIENPSQNPFARTVISDIATNPTENEQKETREVTHTMITGPSSRMAHAEGGRETERDWMDDKVDRDK